MSTTTMNISLPDSLKKSIRDRLEEERYNNPSDYILALVREDLVRRDEKKLEQMLLDGINSGPGVEYGSKEWETFREEVLTSVQKQTIK